MRFNDILRSAVLGLAVLATTLAGPASAQVLDDSLTPLSPVIGIDPTSLDFGSCTLVGQCADLTIDIFNDVNDPTSILEVTSVVVNGAAFAIQSGQTPPYTIAGDGTRITYTIRFCPVDGQAATGSFVVSAGNATNSPQEAALSGTGKSKRSATSFRKRSRDTATWRSRPRCPRSRFERSPGGGSCPPAR